jgi:tRNA-Thr(GGU) m(6)t(6)A37 methyltransferase TsaA
MVAQTGGLASENGAQMKYFKLFAIGKVEKQGQRVLLRIFNEYIDGLLGLDGWSHVQVFYWFDKNDTPQQRKILRVHPRGDNQNPLTGVFACRAPFRPNLIALSVCKILSVQNNLVALDGIDAFDGTPILDLKPFIPMDAPAQNIRVPAWAKPKKQPGS